jgi:DNA-binding transcriptional LysR family regulator
MRITLRQLDHFAAVAELGSFTQAAEARGISQPALSRSIAAIEAIFSVRLFERNRSAAVYLTAAGSALLAHAHRVLLEASSIERDLSMISSGTGGSITLGLSPLVGSILLPPILIDIATNRPNLVVATSLKSPVDLVTDVLERKLEFALVAGPLARGQHELAAEFLGQFRMGLFCRASHPLAHERALSHSQVSQYPICSGASSASLAVIKPTIACENIHILRDVTLGSDAIWLAADRFLRAELASGLIVALDTTWHEQFAPPIEVAVIRTSHRSISPAACAIVDHARQILGDDQSGAAQDSALGTMGIERTR